MRDLLPRPRGPIGRLRRRIRRHRRRTATLAMVATALALRRAAKARRG